MDTPLHADEDMFFFDQRWPVLYVDNHLLAVYKPSGLLVQGDRSTSWLPLYHARPH